MSDYTDKINTLVTQYKSILTNETQCDSNLESRLHELQLEYDKILPIDKPLLTIPVIFGKTYNENFISRYLAHILHPINSGLGYAPLQGLLNFADAKTPLNFLDGHEIQIEPEYQLSEDSRIDLLILLKNIKVLIAIENKIFSSEGHKQTLRYADSIKERFPDYTPILLFLTPYGTPPKSSNFKSISYKELYSIFRTIDLSSASERDRFIFQDLLLHMENYIMKSANLELSEKSVLYLQNFEMINDLQEMFSKDASNIFQTITEIIKSIVDTPENEWQFSFSGDREWQLWFKSNWSMKKIFIHFEFWFSRDTLFTNPGISFMVDVEGKGKDEFLEKFDKIQNSLKTKYQKSSIQYRPPSRRLPIAFKEYRFQLQPKSINRSDMVSFFQNAINEFSFLAEPIDRVIKDNKFK
jgi:hypothetical protein